MKKLYEIKFGSTDSKPDDKRYVVADLITEAVELLEKSVNPHTVFSVELIGWADDIVGNEEV